MIIWINGAFGAGKTTAANLLHASLPDSCVYDPENVGAFIKQSLPSELIKGDFQDHQIWRSINVTVLTYLHTYYDGPIIVPMTVINQQYYYEILGSLRDQGIQVVDFTLLASKASLLNRLKERGDDADSWPAQQIERCTEAFSKERFGHSIDTDHLSPKAVTEQILAEIVCPK